MKLDDLKAGLLNPGWSDCNHHLIMEEAAQAITDLEALVRELARRTRHEQCLLGALDAKGNSRPCTCGLSATLAKLEKARG